MKSLLTIMLITSGSLVLLAQQDQAQSFEIMISTDTVLYDNYLEVRFTAQNIEGRFEPPKFEDFEVISGPNQSTSMSMINGVTSRSASFSYFIKPRTTGTLSIEPAYYLNDQDQNRETQPVAIICLPNPDGVVQESRIRQDHQSSGLSTFPFFRDSPAMPKKKKLKVTKI